MIAITSRRAAAADQPVVAPIETSAPVPAAASVDAAAPAAVAPPPAPAPAPMIVMAADPAPAPVAQGRPITRRWWFWTAIGAAVVGAVVTVLLIQHKPDRPGCPTGDGYVCPP